MVMRVAHAALEVPDVDATVDFYERYIGLVENERDGDIVYLSCGEYHHDLILRPAPAGQPSLHHAALEVAPHTLDRVVERALQHGAHDAQRLDEPGVSDAIRLSVPGGFVLKLIEGSEIRRAPAPEGLRKPLGFSHVNLAGPDVHGLSDFLESALGMRRSDWLGTAEDPFLTWFHCDVDGAPHHGIAIFQSAAPGLHHLSFEYPEIQDLGDRADDYVAHSGRRLVWGMGRHGAGGSAFVYFEDPAAVMVELSQGMIRCGRDPRWEGPRIWSMDDPDGADLWGSPIPRAWIEKFIPLSSAARVSAR